MGQIVVFSIPHSELPSQIGRRREALPVIEGFLIAAMRPLHRPILGGLARVDQIMDDALGGAEAIEGVDGLHGEVGAPVRAEIIVGEGRAIVGLHGEDGVGEPPDHLFQELNGLESAVLLEDPEEPPPRGAVDGRILEIPLAADTSGDILHVDLHELSGQAFRFHVLVFHLPNPVPSDQPLLLQYLPDGPRRQEDAFFLTSYTIFYKALIFNGLIFWVGTTVIL